MSTDSPDNTIDKKEEKSTRRILHGGKLELKKTVDSGQVHQSFSHGRKKLVQVEHKKRMTFGSSAAQKTETATSEQAPPETVSDDGLTPHEREVRMKALEGAEQYAQEKQKERQARSAIAERRRTEEQSRAREQEERSEELAALERQQEQEQRASQQAKKATDTQEEAKPQSASISVKVPPVDSPPVALAPGGEDERTSKRKSVSKDNEQDRSETTRKAPTRKGEPRRRSGKLTITEALGDGEERIRSLASVRRARERQKSQSRQYTGEVQRISHEVVLPETITVQELANRMAERAAGVIKTLMGMGVMASITQTIDADTAELVATELGHTVRRVSEADVEIGLSGGDDDPVSLRPRPPVVTVMGHVDHGKTSLLDALRATDVAAHEAGGITQHIGACTISLNNGSQITFIDTPGHAAFSEMRARGAKVTDIVVLCVAANDGIMPQTVEAINHARAANVPIIVAINKIDAPGADPAKVKSGLAQHEIYVEDMGGETLSVEVSALQKTNLNKLEEAILLQAELMDLKANPDRTAEGVIIESRMEQGRGIVATVIVQRGTLNKGDIFIAGAEWGRVRLMSDERGRTVEVASPGMPIEIQGLQGVPLAGDMVSVVNDEARAREICEYRQRQIKDRLATKTARGSLDQLFQKAQEGEQKILPVVIKADVHGSVEALSGALEKMSTDEAQIQVLHGAVGGINESDVTLAQASNAFIIGFNVRANPQARTMAKRDRVELHYYSIIYDAIDDLKKMLSDMLPPEERETLIGYASVKEVFGVSKIGKAAGCMVTEGRVRRGARVRLLRNDMVIHEGALSQLKRFKDDVEEVRNDTECGMAFANYQDIQVGDVVECFEVEHIARTIS